MKETDAILNWGFNPSSKKSKYSILVSASHLDTEDWPYKIFENNHVFYNPEVFLEFIRLSKDSHNADLLFLDKGENGRLDLSSSRMAKSYELSIYI